ncbi:serine hydrolase domain-containing protein [Tessaracoccus sp.]
MSPVIFLEKLGGMMHDDNALQDALQDLLDEATDRARHRLSPGGPAVPGASALIAHRGQVVARACAGVASLISPEGTPLPRESVEPITPEHLWDIASITKVVVTLATLVQVDRGVVELEGPVAEYLPGFGAGPVGGEQAGSRGLVTVRDLLTHTSGLPATCHPWTVDGDRARRAAHVLGRPLERDPGEGHLYSCVGFMTLGLLLEQLTGRPLSEVLAQDVTAPLGMRSTGYVPIGGCPVAATENQPELGRALVRGVVHDEAAWSLGEAGNAGLFSHADDLFRLGEEVRTGAAGLLTEQSRSLLSRGTLDPAEAASLGYDQAVGFRLGQQSFMGTSDRRVLGHTGFTGTSLVVDPCRETVAVLLTNAVHPTRGVVDANGLRCAVALLSQTGTSTPR